jgi:hypothetical protein
VQHEQRSARALVFERRDERLRSRAPRREHLLEPMEIGAIRTEERYRRLAALLRRPGVVRVESSSYPAVSVQDAMDEYRGIVDLVGAGGCVR